MRSSQLWSAMSLAAVAGLATAAIAAGPTGAKSAGVQAPANSVQGDKAAGAPAAATQSRNIYVDDMAALELANRLGLNSGAGLRGASCDPINDSFNCHLANLTLGANFSGAVPGNFRTMDNVTISSDSPTQLCWIGRYAGRVNPIANESFSVRIFSDDAGFPDLSAPIFERVFVVGGTPGVNQLTMSCLDTCPGTSDPASGGHWVFSAQVTGGFPLLAGGCYWLEVAVVGSQQGGWPSDWNGDGIVNSGDITAFLGDWLTGNGDYNEDGLNNSGDITAFLTDWLAQVGQPAPAGVNWGWVGSSLGTDAFSLQAINGNYTTFSRVENDRSFCFSGGVDPFAGNCVIQPLPPICNNNEANGIPFVTGVGTIFRSSYAGSVPGNWTPFEIAENFTFTSPQTVTNICFTGYWGLPAAAGQPIPFAASVPPGRRGLRVTYYGNNGITGVPGAPVPMAAFTVGDPGVDLIDNSDTFTYQASMTHPAVNFTADNCYWVSIAALNVHEVEAEFFWRASATAAGAVDGRLAFRNIGANPPGPWSAFTGFNLPFLLDAGPAIATACDNEPPPPPPVNDNCTAAILLATPSVGNPTTVNGTTLGSTLDGVPVCGTADANASPGVWYRVVGTGAQMNASTCASPQGYDGQLAVFSGTCGGLICQDGGDDNCGVGGGMAQGTWNSVAGVEYLIHVYGWGGSTGNFELVVSTQ